MQVSLARVAYSCRLLVLPTCVAHTPHPHHAGLRAPPATTHVIACCRTPRTPCTVSRDQQAAAVTSYLNSCARAQRVPQQVHRRALAHLRPPQPLASTTPSQGHEFLLCVAVVPRTPNNVRGACAGASTAPQSCTRPSASLARFACKCRLLVSLTRVAYLRVTYVCRSHAPPTPRWSQSTARNHARDCVLSHASHPMHGVTRPTGRSSHELSQLVRACAARPSTSAPSRTCALATTSTTRKHHTISRSRVPTLRRGCAANAEQRAGCVRGREHRPAVMHSP